MHSFQNRKQQSLIDGRDHQDPEEASRRKQNLLLSLNKPPDDRQQKPFATKYYIRHITAIIINLRPAGNPP